MLSVTYKPFMLSIVVPLSPNLAVSSHSLTCGLYYKHILTIVSDACTTVSLVFALALASVINYARNLRHSLEHHLLMTLKSSFRIVICL